MIRSFGRLGKVVTARCPAWEASQVADRVWSSLASLIQQNREILGVIELQVGLLTKLLVDFILHRQAMAVPSAQPGRKLEKPATTSNFPGELL